MKKLLIKIAINLIMTLGFLLMFSTRATGQNFHEYGGLAVIVLLATHAAMNYKWIPGIAKKLFAKKLKLKTRLEFLIDALLAICVIAIAFSGLVITRSLPFRIPIGGSGVWKTLHVSVACLALALSGLHLGLHFGWISGVVKKATGRERIGKVPKVAGICVLITLMLYGLLNISGTGYIRSLSGFTSVLGTNVEQNRQREDKGRPADIPESRGERGNDSGKPSKRPEASGGIRRADFAGALTTILSYFSIMNVFAGISFLLQRLFKKRGKKLSAV